MAQWRIFGLDKIVIEHMGRESGHTEEAFCHYARSSSDFDFCCLTEVTDSRKPEFVEVVDTEMGTEVANTEQRRCTNKGSMAQKP